MTVKSLYILTITAILAIAACKVEDDSYNMNLPPSPQNLTVSKGDTSVFLKWDAVESASSYLIVRGKKVIAKDLKSPSFEDPFGPDTLVEYRVYAVNEDNWRSYEYASDSGFVAIPPGILPRPPAVTASTDNFRNCTLTFTGGRFALKFKVYRDGVLLADTVTGNTFVDKAAPTSAAEYRVYSVNNNGSSLAFTKAIGKKAFFFNETFEDLADGYELKPWTFRAPTVGYYTEGGPKVTASGGFESSAKALKIITGKVQQLCDWGGVPEAGRYRISVAVKKADGGFWMVPSFAGAEHVSANGEWKRFQIETGQLNKGGTFNLKIEPYGTDPALIDSWSIEYIDTK